MSNLDFLKTAVFLNKESNKDEDGKINVVSKDFNQIFIDPYKSFILNTAARLKTEESISINDNFEIIHDSEGVAEAIKSYIIMNLKDILIAVGSTFVDNLSGQFIYDQAQYDDHYEYEFPFSMITKNEKDIVEEAYNQVFTYEIISNLISEHSVKNGIENESTNLTIQRQIGIMFDRLYSILLRTYFNEIITRTATFYINKSEIISDFYVSFLEQQFTPYESNGYNNAYSFITITLRDLITPILESFKDCLFAMSNVVSSMILGYSKYSYSMNYDEFLLANPFAYEIIKEKYDSKNDEDEEEDYDEEG